MELGTVIIVIRKMYIVRRYSNNKNFNRNAVFNIKLLIITEKIILFSST